MNKNMSKQLLNNYKSMFYYLETVSGGVQP